MSRTIRVDLLRPLVSTITIAITMRLPLPLPLWLHPWAPPPSPRTTRSCLKSSWLSGRSRSRWRQLARPLRLLLQPLLLLPFVPPTVMIPTPLGVIRLLLRDMATRVALLAMTRTAARRRSTLISHSVRRTRITLTAAMNRRIVLLMAATTTLISAMLLCRHAVAQAAAVAATTTFPLIAILLRTIGSCAILAMIAVAGIEDLWTVPLDTCDIDVIDLETSRWMAWTI